MIKTKTVPKFKLGERVKIVCEEFLFLDEEPVIIKKRFWYYDDWIYVVDLIGHVDLDPNITSGLHCLESQLAPWEELTPYEWFSRQV